MQKKPINARLKKRVLIDLGSGHAGAKLGNPRLMQLHEREKLKEQIRKRKTRWELIGIDPSAEPLIKKKLKDWRRDA
ncbi:hypothetical protein HZB89_02115, partial [archaeon]|nr:hypothetical protein [archaeon]